MAFTILAATATRSTGASRAPRATRPRRRLPSGPWLGAVLAVALACASAAPRAGHDAAATAAEYAAAGRHLDAAREIEIALRRRPTDPALRLQAAPIHEAVGALHRAAEDLEIATRGAPGDPAAWQALADFETRRGDFDAAYVAARRAHRLAPEDAALSEAFARAAERAGLGADTGTARRSQEGRDATPRPASRSEETRP